MILIALEFAGVFAEIAEQFKNVLIALIVLNLCTTADAAVHLLICNLLMSRRLASNDIHPWLDCSSFHRIRNHLV